MIKSTDEKAHESRIKRPQAKGGTYSQSHGVGVHAGRPRKDYFCVAATMGRSNGKILDKSGPFRRMLVVASGQRSARIWHVLLGESKPESASCRLVSGARSNNRRKHGSPSLRHASLCESRAFILGISSRQHGGQSPKGSGQGRAWGKARSVASHGSAVTGKDSDGSAAHCQWRAIDASRSRDWSEPLRPIQRGAREYLGVRLDSVA